MLQTSDEEECADWLVLSRNQNSAVLKRGNKDFAPDGTKAQEATVEQSLKAMYEALSVPRAQIGKHVLEGDWDPIKRAVKIRKPKGTFALTMGFQQNNVLWFHPEEALYVIERVSMLCYYNSVPLSLQGAFSLLLPHVGAEKLLVYTYLKKHGYIMRRAPAPKKVNSNQVRSIFPQFHISYQNLVCFITQPWHKSFAWRPCYHSYGDIYRDLQFVVDTQGAVTDVEPIDYYAWKPGTKFKKSDPGLPHFYIKVVDAKVNAMPTLSTIRALLANDYAERAPKHRRTSIITQIREGQRMIILALVDSGIVNFVKVVDTKFPCIIN